MPNVHDVKQAMKNSYGTFEIPMPEYTAVYFKIVHN